MKDAPTLADGLLREWQKPLYAQMNADNVDSKWLLRNLSEARKFVLDKNMSAFLSDLAYATISKDMGGNRRAVILDSMRRQARLPHKITWIEYDFKAKAKRAVEQYDAEIDLNPEETPDRDGWLCMQHPQLETAFLALQCASHAWHMPRKRVYQPSPAHIAYTWRTDDGPPPWSNADIADYLKIMGRVAFVDGSPDQFKRPESLISGILEYESESVKIIKSPHVTLRYVKETWDETHPFNPLKELAGDLRHLWAFLATLNDIPVSISDVRASKGFLRGKQHKFVEHKIIHLSIPEKHYRKVAAQAIAITRRRAHPVRGHFRIDRHKPPSPMCDHEWGPADEHGHLTCNICHGRKLYIHEHMRGDASLGIVTHDYVVEHEPI